MTNTSRFSFEQLERRLKMKLGEDESLEFKSHLFENKKGINNPILKGVVALANAFGGNLIIGVTRQNQEWVICGTSLDQELVNNWLSQIVYEYVEPDGLSFEVYAIEPTERDLKCIGILVHKLNGRYFAVRYSGRSSKEEGRLSYYFPMRIGSSTQLLDSFSFMRNIFSSWVIGLSEISKTQIFSTLPISDLREKRPFNLEEFKIRIDELAEIEEDKTRRMLLEELRNMVVNLPFNHSDPWTENLTKLVFQFLDILHEEIATNDMELKNRVLDMLYIVANRCDDKTLKKMENDFLGILEKFYSDPRIEKTSHLIRLLQILNHYDPQYMENMVKDALEKWNINDFSNRFSDIEIGRYVSEHADRLKKLRSYALKNIENARRSENHQMLERFEKLYNRIRSEV